MSFNWENVIWQSKDRTWSIGLFERISNGDSWDSDYDAEWDDDYDQNKFHFASTGHATPESAKSAWKGTNPGGHTSIPWEKGNFEEIKQYELMAEIYADPALGVKLEKAKIAKERRDFRAKLRADASLIPREFSNYMVWFNKNLGRSGVLKRDGDWLVLEGMKSTLKNGKTKTTLHKVWNTKTENIGPEVTGIDKIESPRRGGWYR